MYRKALLAFTISLVLWSQPGECQYDVWHAVDEAFVVCPPLPKPNPLPDGMTSAQWPTKQEYPVTIAYDHGLAEDKWHVVTFFRQQTGAANITFDVKDYNGQTVIERTTVDLGVDAPSDCSCTGNNGRVDTAKYGQNYGKTCFAHDAAKCSEWNNQTGSWCCDAWCYVNANCKDAQSSIFNPGAYYSYTGACPSTPKANNCQYTNEDPCTCTNIDAIEPYASSGRAAIEGAGYGASCKSWSYERACGDSNVIPPNRTDIWCCQSWCWVKSGECKTAIASDLYPGIFWSRAKCPDDETKVNTCPWKAKTSHDPVPTPAPTDSTCACLGWMPKTLTSGRRRAGKAWPSNYGATCAAHDKTYCDQYFKQMTPGIWCCERWCYVDEACPSSIPSSLANGHYWSREACADDPGEMQFCAFSDVCTPSTTGAIGLPDIAGRNESEYGVGCGAWDKDNCWAWWGNEPDYWSSTNNDWCCESWTYVDEGCPFGAQGNYGKSYSYELCPNSGPQKWDQASKTCVDSRRLDNAASDEESGWDGDREDQGASDEEHSMANENEMESTEEVEDEVDEDAEEEREEDGHKEGGEGTEDAEEKREEDGHEEDAEDEDGDEDESEQMQEQAPQSNLRAFASERVLGPARQRRRTSSTRRRSPNPGRRRAPSKVSVPDTRRRAASPPPARRRQPSSVPPSAPARRRQNPPAATSGRRRQPVSRPTPPPTPRPTPPPRPTPAPAPSTPRRRRSPSTPAPPEGRRRQPTAARRRASITPAQTQRRRQPGGTSSTISRRRQVGTDGRVFESPRRRRSPAGSSPTALSGRRRAQVGYTNTNMMMDNYNNQMPSKTAYGHTGVAKPAGSTAKIAMAATAGVAGGALLGAGAYYAYSRYNQDTASGGAGAGTAFQDNRFCQVPNSDTVNKGKLIRCDDCIAAYGSSCPSLNDCFGDEGCNYKLPKQTTRDDVMTASFLPSQWVGPLTITIYNITGADYTPALVCPPLPDTTVDSNGNVKADWKKAASVNTDLFVTFSEVGEALDENTESCNTDTKQPCRGASQACSVNEQCTDGYCECVFGWCLTQESIQGTSVPSCTFQTDVAGTANVAVVAPVAAAFGIMLISNLLRL